MIVCLFVFFLLKTNMQYYLNCIIFAKFDSKIENVTLFGMDFFVIKLSSLFHVVFCFEKTFKTWERD